MNCPHPRCTGVHDNNRYRELCPRSVEGKREKDLRYQEWHYANDPMFRIRKMMQGMGYRLRKLEKEWAA